MVAFDGGPDTGWNNSWEEAFVFAHGPESEVRPAGKAQWLGRAVPPQGQEHEVVAANIWQTRKWKMQAGSRRGYNPQRPVYANTHPTPRQRHHLERGPVVLIRKPTGARCTFNPHTRNIHSWQNDF